MAPMSVLPIYRSPPRSRLAAIGVMAWCATVGILAGCGGSSKPAYCSSVNDFKNAVAQLKSVSSPSDIVSAAKNVESTGQKAVSQVKTSFAPETSAVKSSLATLATSLTQLTSSSTRASAVSAIPGNVSAVSSAADNFANAAKSKCS
jgi:hypothetical protein